MGDVEYVRMMSAHRAQSRIKLKRKKETNTKPLLHCTFLSKFIEQENIYTNRSEDKSQKRNLLIEVT